MEPLDSKLFNDIIRGDFNKVKDLIDKEAKVNAQSKDGNTPLHLAAKAKKGHLYIVKLLIDKGAKFNAQSKDGNAPLHWSAKNGHLEVVECLIKEGAKVNIQSKDGNAPLHWSAENGYLDIVEFLINKGADVNAKNKDNETPLYWAARNGHLKVVECLIKERAKVNEALYCAAVNNDNEIFDFLIEKEGVDVDKALSYIIEQGYNKEIDFFFIKKSGVNHVAYVAAQCKSNDVLRYIEKSHKEFDFNGLLTSIYYKDTSELKGDNQKQKARDAIGFIVNDKKSQRNRDVCIGVGGGCTSICVALITSANLFVLSIPEVLSLSTFAILSLIPTVIFGRKAYQDHKQLNNIPEDIKILINDMSAKKNVVRNKIQSPATTK